MELPKSKTPISKSIDEYTYLFYGRPKIGKTTFASHFPSALFLATEHGHKFVEVFRLNPKNWGDVHGAVKNLCTTEHDFKTVVIDTADNLFTMCAKHVCEQMGIQHQSDADFGKAYDRIKLQLKGMTDTLTQHGMGVVFISHTADAEVQEKIVTTGSDGEQIQLTEKVKKTDSTLSGTAKKVIHGLCDFILYAYGDDSGKRWLRTKETTTIVCGDRTGYLPEIMPLDYPVFRKELETAVAKKIEDEHKQKEEN